MLLCYEVTRDLPLEWVEIETPMTRMKARQDRRQEAGVRADPARRRWRFVEGMLDLVPTARVAHIGLYRDPETLGAVEYIFKAPADLAARLVIVVSPVVATANTAVAAIDRLKERGAKRHPRRLPARVAGRASSGCAASIRTCRSGPPRSTISSTATPTSCPASATPATAPTARNSRYSPPAGCPGDSACCCAASFCSFGPDVRCARSLSFG